MRSLAVATTLSLAAVIGADRTTAATLVVDSTADAVDAAPGDGVCDAASGECTLRAAVQEANALPGSDAITLPPGTYVLAIPGALEDAGATGDLDITDELTISGAGSRRSTVDAGGLDRAFETIGLNLSSFSAAMEGLTIRNGSAEGGGFESGDGGGIFNGNRIALTLDDVAIVNNRATIFGGGIRSNSFTSSLTISNSVLSGNVAGQGGAAVSNQGTAVLRNTSIADNSAVLGAGAIDTSGGVSLELVDSTITGSTGTIGTIFSGGTLTVENSQLTNNTAAAGGGIYGGGLLSVLHSTISSNTAAFGEGGHPLQLRGPQRGGADSANRVRQYH